MELKEAEYVAAASASQKGIWPQRIRKDFGVAEKEADTMFCINMSAVLMTRYPVFHGSAKHIEIKQYCIGEQVNGGAIDKQY